MIFNDTPTPDNADKNTINIGSTPPQLSDPVLTDRANRADFALGEKSPGSQALKDQFAAGGEPQARQTAAAMADVDFRQDKLNIIKQAQTQGTPITPDQIDGLMSVGKTPDSNPDTVFEDKFAKNLVNTAVASNPKNDVYSSAFEHDPEKVSQAMQVSMSAISRKQQAKDIYELATPAYDTIPWFNTSEEGRGQQDKAGNLFKTVLSGGISEIIDQHNLIDSKPIGSVLSWLPGTNKMEQIQSLYLLPLNEFKPALMAAAGPGSPLWKEAPTDAMAFLKAATQYSTSEAFVDDLMGIANVASFLPVGSLIKGIRYMRGGAEVPQIGVQTLEQAQKTAQGVLKESSAPPKVPLSPGGEAASNAASDVLAAPATPPTQKFYVPEAAIKRPWETQPRVGEVRVENGKPRIFTQDGAEVALGTTPEVGHIPVEVTPGTTKNTFTTREGTFEHQSGTIYVDKAGADRLSKVLDTEGGRKTILQQGDGRYSVGDLDHQTPGKTIRGTITSASETPARGLYPIDLSGEKPQFGQKITRVDEATAPGVKFGDTIVAKEEYESRVALADVIKSQAETDPKDVLSKMGHHEEASTLAATERLSTDLNLTPPRLGDGEAIRRSIPSVANPMPFYDTSMSLSWKRGQELALQAKQSSTDIADALENPLRVERLTKPALDRATDIAKEQVRQKYNRNADAIADQVRYWDAGSNTYYIETRFTKKTGELFDTSAQATHYKNLQYKLGASAEVKQEGNQFYISHIQHVDETQSGVRDTLIVANNETPQGTLNTWLNALTGKALGGGNLGLSPRSSAYTVSEFQRQQRIVATHAPSVLRQAIDEAAKDLTALGGRWTTRERQDLQQILEQNRDQMLPNGDRGVFYNSAREFEDAYFQRFNKLPSEKQTTAYETYTRLSDLDWTLREYNTLRDKARMGIRNFKTSFTSLDELGLPSKVDTEWFNGKLVKDFEPLATANANVYVVPRGKLTTKHDLKDKTTFSTEVNDKLKSGEYQIIQAYNPREKPMMATTGVKDDIHFIVVDKYQDKAIQFGENVPYQPGGHVIYQDQNFLKQPQIGLGTNGRDTHFGDMTFKSFPTKIETDKWAAEYNTARDLHRSGDEVGLKAFFDAGRLPETLQDWKRMVSDGTINLDQPFVHTLSGRDTLQSNIELQNKYPGLKDTFTSYNLSQNAGGAFLADRGTQLNTIANVGTEANPIYNNVPSRLYDPYTSLQKGMGEIVRQRWMADYKMEAAESWIQEFGMLFDQSKLPLEKLRQNPIYYMYHTDAIDRGMLKANPELGTAAMVSRKNILSFIGARDEASAAIEGLEIKLISKIDSIAGSKVATFAEERALPAIKNVPTYARTVAFDAVEGIFNIVQLAQQGMAAFHAIAISPVNGMKGLSGAVLVRLFRHTEDAAILDHAANIAAAGGWDKAHFMEALQGWKDSGVSHIGGEVAMLSDVKEEPTFTKTIFGTIIDKGRGFFRAGDRVGRDVSWFTAYHDWRDANPGRVLDNRAGTEIMSKFDTYNMNMTRASNAAYNEGVLSVPTQFWTWNARFTEQMLGNQLTLGEKARAFGMYAAMYGVPSTLGGITFGVIPYMNYSDIRQYALTKGINVSDKWYQAFSEGIPSMLLNAVTGHDTSLHRFSPDATQLKDALDGKKDLVQLLGGASGQMAGQMASAVWPALMYGYAAIKGKDVSFPLKFNDLLDFAENASSFNNTEKMIVGLNMGKYYSKTEGFNTDVDRFESLALGLGLNPQRLDDAYQMIDYTKHLKTAQEKIEKKMIEDFKLGFEAAGRGDNQGMTDYMSRVHAASVAGGFTSKQEDDILKKAVRGSESLVDSVNDNWVKKSLELQNIPALQQYFNNQKKK